MTHSYVRHVAFIRDKTQSYVRNDSFIREARTSHTCDMTHSTRWGGALRIGTRTQNGVKNCQITRYTIWANSSSELSASLQKGGQCRRVMQGSYAEEVPPPSSPTAPLGSKSCTACVGLIPLIPRDGPLCLLTLLGGLACHGSSSEHVGACKVLRSHGLHGCNLVR